MELKKPLNDIEHVLDQMIENQRCYEKIVRLTKFAYEVCFLTKMQDSLIGGLLHLVDSIEKNPGLKNIGYNQIKNNIDTKCRTLKNLKFTVPKSALDIFRSDKPKLRKFRLKNYK
jgi:hypothetical protein